MIVIQQTPRASIRSGKAWERTCTRLSARLSFVKTKLICEVLGNYCFLTLGYANLTLVCVYCFAPLLCIRFVEAFSLRGTDLNSRTPCKTETGKKEPCEFSNWVYQFGNQRRNSRFTSPLRQIQWYSIKSNRNAMHSKSGHHTKKSWVSVCVGRKERQRRNQNYTEMKGASLFKPRNIQIQAQMKHMHTKSRHTHSGMLKYHIYILSHRKHAPTQTCKSTHLIDIDTLLTQICLYKNEHIWRFFKELPSLTVKFPLKLLGISLQLTVDRRET